MSDQSVMVHVRPEDVPSAYVPDIPGSPFALVKLDSHGMAHVLIPNRAYLRALIEQLLIVEAGIALREDAS
jgi:hypothetical protein